MSLKYTKILNGALATIQDAGALILSRCSERQGFVIKSNATDVLTKLDTEVEKILICGFTEKFPSIKIISEEKHPKNEELTDCPTWLIDPVDGSMNLVHTYPYSTISVALVVDRIPRIGIVYNAIMRHMFTAIEGGGAFFNQKRMHVSPEKLLCQALIMAEFGSRDDEKLKIVNENFKKLSYCAHGFRSTGSAALNLAMVALGAADANYEMGIHFWDVAAGELLVREAGGVVIDPDGSPFDLLGRRILAASTMELANELADQLTIYNAEPKDK